METVGGVEELLCAPMPEIGGNKYVPGKSDMAESGKRRTNTRPIIFARGTGPHTRLSEELGRLSPMTKYWSGPSVTVCGTPLPLFARYGSLRVTDEPSGSSIVSLLPSTCTVSPGNPMMRLIKNSEGFFG